ncbi:MAG: metal ABC transporter permease [Planctomycetia bacterium]
MNILSQWDWSYDGMIVLAGVLCAIAASLPGNFLVLRRISLLGDAVSHAVLPGLAAAFLITHSRSGVAVLVGAVAAGLLTAVLTEWIRDTGKVDEGASMGVVFTTLFALGLVMIVQAADSVDLDPGCVLYGVLEATPLDTVAFGTFEIPRVVIVLGSVVVMNAVFVSLFFKELLISSFDPGLATSEGFSARVLHYLLMILVAITAVASFEAAGNILVVAMFIVPPATAVLLTTRLSHMIVLSAGLAAASAVLGHLSALTIPALFGFRSTSTAGMMTLCSGLIFIAAALFSPQTGMIVTWIRRQRLAIRILSEDMIALLFRLEERSPEQSVQIDTLAQGLLTSRLRTRIAVARQKFRGYLLVSADGVCLTETGRIAAAAVVRSHRLWESYLVTEGIDAELIHRQAEKLEHFTDRSLRDRLQKQGSKSEIDPHGSPIPEETDHQADLE